VIHRRRSASLQPIRGVEPLAYPMLEITGQFSSCPRMFRRWKAMAVGSEPTNTGHEQQLLLAQRARVGRIDSLGILGVAILVPLILRNSAPLSPLLVWSTLVVLTTVGWSVRVPRFQVLAHTIAVWASGLVWSILPWMVWGSLDDRFVAWSLVLICGYGLATDAILLPQAFNIRAYPLMFAYLVSFLVALALRSHWVPLASLLLLSAHLAAGIRGFELIKHELLANQAQAESEAHQDPLTGLASRGAVIREIQVRLAHKEDVHCVIADVDNFKAINTHLGHHGGDAALQALAEELQSRLPGWYLARLGGDEFVAINRRGLHPSEEGMLTTVDLGKFGPSGGRQLLSLSIGASSIRPDGTPDQLLTEASAALRQAKTLGKRRVVIADDEIRFEEEARQRLAARAHAALQDQEIVSWGQPIFDLPSGRAVGVELLARWPQPDGRIERPDDFVPVIEAQGLGLLLGEQMVLSAVELLRSFDRIGDHTSFVSVNLSALVLLEPDLATMIADQLKRANVKPHRLIIEMTESQRLPETIHAHEAFAHLRTVGVGVASDDLGAGWSSLNQMIKTAFTHVKIDRTLMAINRTGTDDLLSALCRVALGAGQIPIAEGIETDDDLDRARRAGIELGQGYLLARPAPLGALLAHFRVEPDDSQGSAPTVILDDVRRKRRRAATAGQDELEL